MISTKLGTSSSAWMAAGDQGQVTGRKSLIMMEIFVPRLTHATPSTSSSDLSWRVLLPSSCYKESRRFAF